MELRDQLLLEDDLILQGADRYTTSTTSAQDQGRGADTGYGQRLLINLLRPVAQGLQEFSNSGARKHGKYRKITKAIDPEVMAYIGLKTVLNSLHLPRSVTQVALDIGLYLEDEQRFSSFKETNPEYYKVVMQDFKRKNTKAYRHLRNVMAVTSKKKGLEWDAWTKETRLGVGSVVLDQVVAHTDLVTIQKKQIKKNKYTHIVSASMDAVKWIEGYNEYASLLHPYTKPCIIEPDDWSSVTSGGYWSEAMRLRNPFIKGLSGEALKFVESHDLTRVFKAVNSIQRTPWTINKEVLEVMQTMWASNNAISLPKKEPSEIPKFRVDTPPKEMDTETFQEFLVWKAKVSQMYTDEISRSSRAYEVARIIKMAANYAKYDALWFVYQCDFRGRGYASSSGLNPQGSDYNKALLRFKDGKALGVNGLYWLAVHGSNCYGVDKVSFDQRVAWTTENLDSIRKVKEDPVSMAYFWEEADNPYMFLSFCMEYADAVKDPEGFISYIPVGMDGSCNGLQNFSALLRDKVGGQATNLMPSEQPADIYKQVAQKCFEKLKEMPHSDLKMEWLAFADKHDGISRKIAKRPVMTLPYGSTKYSCFGFVVDALLEIDRDYFTDLNAAASYLNDLLWDSISDVVVSARDAMGWLQEVAKLTSQHNLPMWWVNPVGFPVYQKNTKVDSKRVRTALFGDTRLSINQSTDTISVDKQVQGIAPNFVHSLDSAHMWLTVNKAEEHGITSFAMIHDDFGTHAADVELFRNVISHTFVSMYIDNDPLYDLYLTASMSLADTVIPDLPKKGDLNIEKVIESEYFFA